MATLEQNFVLLLLPVQWNESKVVLVIKTVKELAHVSHGSVFAD
jgi:hypothetical protein